MNSILDNMYEHKRTRNDDDDVHKKVKQNYEIENTPKVSTKQLELNNSHEDSDLFLDEVFSSACDDLSLISENANMSEKWQDESSIDMLLEAHNTRRKEVDEEEHLEEKRFNDQMTEYLSLISNEERQTKIEMIYQMIDIARNFNGTVVSFMPLCLQCKAGHKWTSDMERLLRREWCNRCQYSGSGSGSGSGVNSTFPDIQNDDRNNIEENRNNIEDDDDINNIEDDEGRNNMEDVERNNISDILKVIINNYLQQIIIAKQNQIKLQQMQILVELLQNQVMQGMQTSIETGEIEEVIGCQEKALPTVLIHQQQLRYEQQQRNLFEKVKKQFRGGEQNQKIIKAFKEMEAEIDKASHEHANRYLENEAEKQKNSSKTIANNSLEAINPNSSLNTTSDTIRSDSIIGSSSLLPQIVALYKILLMPEDALSMYVKAQSKSILIKEYKSFARLVHPDKNRHPKACKAFLKLRNFWVDYLLEC